MRATWKAQKPDNRISAGASVPPPTGGWDAVSPLAAMPADRAVVLDNFIPRPGYIEVRGGYAEHATGLGAAVETLMTWNGPGQSLMFGAAGDTIYDVTNPGAAVATTVTAQSNARFQHVNFTNSSGLHFLLAANGVDAMWSWNGTAWSQPTITGISSSDIIQPWGHKKRLWFVLSGSTKVAYLPVEAIAGAAVTFELGSLMARGGYVMAMTTWTVNTAQTIDDYAVFVTSRGQVIVYQGTDPANASTWSLVGVYDIGTPIGRRCLTRLGGDVAIICIDGILPLSQVLNTDRVAADRISITAVITNAMNQAATQYSANFGWQFTPYPRGTLVILNIPVAESVSSMQFAMNTLTGAWCRFLGINAICWEILEDRIFFGAPDGTVYEWDIGSSDNGTSITAESQSAFNYFETPGYQKMYKMVQPLITSDGTVTPGLGLNVDFKQGAQISAPTVAQQAQALWDTALWDVAMWPNEYLQTANWTTVWGVGQCASIVTKVTTGETSGTNRVLLQVNGWNIVMEKGSFL